MTQNQTINVGLMSAFGLLVGGLTNAFAKGSWYGLAEVLAIVLVATAYELLP